MKMIRLVTNPYVLIVAFSCVLISGKHLGGFYLLYILLGLPHAAIHSVLGMAGIILIVFSDQKLGGTLKFVSNLIGLFLMVASLFVFFYRDKENYNIGTFYQVVPQLVFALFLVISIGFAVNNAVLLSRELSKEHIGN